MNIIRKLFTSDHLSIDSGILVGTTLIAYFFNFLYNAYLGRVVDIDEFAIIAVLGSILSIVEVGMSGFGRSVTYKSAYYFGQHKIPATLFWRKVRKNALKISLFISLLWLLLVPFMNSFFHIDSGLALVYFTPVWLVGILASIDIGFLSGSLKFTLIATASLMEALSKLLISILIIQLGFSDTIYAALPLSMFLSFLITWRAAHFLGELTPHKKAQKIHFPWKFMWASVMNKISTVIYLSADIMLAQHFLSATQAGLYVFISLTGKMVFFSGSLFNQFVTPIVSRDEGAKKNSFKSFFLLLSLTTLATFGAFSVFGLCGFFVAPILFGKHVLPIIKYLPLYAGGMMAFTLASTIIMYHQIKKQYVFSLISFLFSLVEILVLSTFHNGIGEFVDTMATLGIVQLLVIGVFHVLYVYAPHVMRAPNLKLNVVKPKKTTDSNSLNVLIFNWYDTKHSWGGGAELYIHNIAKNLIIQGHRVTIFCGNDGSSKKFETVEGVKIIRKGGLYSVPLCAAWYYVTRLHGKYDVIIDSAKGVPFFTPLFIRKPILALVCHVHQEMFRSELSFPVREISMFLEGRLMPFIYRNVQLLTISKSSKNAMEKLGLGKNKDIQIILPGVNYKKVKAKKTAYPSILYVGRLRDYKNIDVLIHAMPHVLKLHKNAKLIIAGVGDMEKSLKKLTNKLNLEKHVVFTGKVTERKKYQLYASSWICAQPSMVEGWGLTNIEANICGTPVVASNVEGLRESVIHGKTGLLVKVKSATSFANAINLLIDRPTLRKTLGKNGKIWAKNFEWESASNKFNYLLLSEVNKKAPGIYTPAQELAI